MLMKRRNAVATVIVLFICVAVYLNWSYTRGAIERERAAGLLPEEEILVISDEATKKPVEEKRAPESSDEYFNGARLDRQKARDNAMTILKQTAEEEKLSQETRDKAAMSMEGLAQGAVSEVRIESLIKAKGFVDCVALLNDENINIIVQTSSGELTAADTAKIKDIVIAETQLRPEQIKIVEIG